MKTTINFKHILSSTVLLIGTSMAISSCAIFQSNKSSKANTAQVQTPAHVIITAGQSNTDGRVLDSKLPDYIKAMATDTVKYEQGAYRHCRISRNNTDGTFTPFWPTNRITDPKKPQRWAYDAVFYYLIEQDLNEDFYVIKWAVGGTGIQPTENGRYFWSADSTWLSQNKSSADKGKSLLLSFTQNIDSCIDCTLSKLPQGYIIDAFLWHQGESDRHFGKLYYDNLKAVVTYVRQHLTEKTGHDYSRLPFFFGTVSRLNKQYSADVENGMRRLANDKDFNAYLIDLSTAELQGDKLHFTEKSAEEFGKRLYEKFKEVKRAEK